VTVTVRLFVLYLTLSGAVACATHGVSPAEVAKPVELKVEVPLHGKPLTLHLTKPAAALDPNVLVLYASGDGGWFGTAVDMFHEIGRAGFAAVGFSSRAFLRIDRPRHKTLDPLQLAAEYAEILDRAQETLGLAASSKAVLTGWSRGAAFAVLASGETPMSSRTRGVVAIGPSDGEDLAVSEAGDDEGEPTQAGRPWPFLPYRRIASLGALPVAVIQATHDQFLPAAGGRALFGADTASRRFVAIEAKNHRFSGGKEAFAAAFQEALRWTASVPSAVTPIHEVP